MKCQNLGCNEYAEFRVEGEFKGDSYGWSGVHCKPHAISVVEHQIFQTLSGATITVRGIA